MRMKIWDLLFIIERNQIYTSIKKGFMLTFLIFLFGSITRLFYAIPINSVHELIYNWHDGLLDTSLLALDNITSNYISLFLVITISYYYSLDKISNPLLVLMSVTTSLVNFLMSLQIFSTGTPYDLLAIPGIFLAICTAIISVIVFEFFIKLLTRKYSLSDLGSEENLKMSWISVFPMLSTLALGSIICVFLADIMHGQHLYDSWIQSISLCFTDSSNELLQGIVYLLNVNLLWFFGIHGGNALEPILSEFLIPATTDTTAIISQGFFATFVQIGGCGTVFCLMLALILVSKNKHTRDGKAMKWLFVFVPFNISELIVFGFPLILNPILLIPLLLVPIVSFLIAYTATIIGFLPIVNESVLWTIPVGFNGYLSTNSIAGLIVQVLILCVGTMIYIPFVKIYERFQEEKEARILDLLIQDFRSDEKDGVTSPLLSRCDVSGQVAKAVAKQLRSDIDNQRIELYFQPQHDASDAVIGAEALLRWKYQDKILYPPFVIALAQEEGIADSLALVSLRIVTSSIMDITTAVGMKLHFSINFTATQINNNLFVQRVIDMIDSRGVADMIYLELTEETSISGLENLEMNIKRFERHGVNLAIDDFGMGQTSLNYLKENNFKYVKLDGELIKQLTVQPRCGEIITSIVNLGKTLNYEVIAEYVETKELKEQLMNLGCNIYQGYYYSPAIPKDDFITYCATRHERTTV